MQQPRAMHKRAGALSAAALLAFSGLMLATPANADDATAPADATSTSTAPASPAVAEDAPAQDTPAKPAPTNEAGAEEEAAAEDKAAATELPSGLAEAVLRDLGMSLEEFIAAGELGEKAAEALPGLQQIEGFVSLRLADDQMIITGSGDKLAAAAAELGAVLEDPADVAGAEASTEAEDAAAAVETEAPADAAQDAETPADEAATEEAPGTGSAVASDVESLLQDYVRKVGSTKGLRSVMQTGPGEFTIKLGTPLDALPAEPAGSLIRMASAPLMTPAEFAAEYANVTVEHQPQPLTTFQDVPGGTGILTGTEEGPAGTCSVGFNGFRSGDAALLTAGHCTGDGAANLAILEPLEGENDLVLVGEFSFSQFGAKNNAPSPLDPENANRGTDVAVLENINDELDLTAEVTRRGGNTDPNADTVRVTGAAEAVLGSPVCKSGRTTFWTCGEVTELGIFFVGGTNIMEDDEDIRAVWGFGSTDLVAAPGDSGGSIVSGTNAVGLISSGIEGVITNGASLSDAVSYIPGGFELAVFLAKPELTDPANEGSVLTGQPITGTVENAPAGTEVQVTFDGGEPQTVQVAENGTWSITAPGITDEDTTERELAMTARAVNGNNKSSTAEFTLTLEKAPLDAPAFTTPATVVGEVKEISGTGVAGATVAVEVTAAGEQGEAAALAELPLTETVEVKEDGSWTVEFEDALKPGSYKVTALQTKTGMLDSKEATLDLSVIYAAPAITNLKDGQEFTEGSTPESITGTARPGATVTVAVGNALATGTTEADDEGRWSYDVDPWTAGEYLITASQQVDGVGSDFTEVTIRVAALQVAPGGNPGPADPGTPGNPGPADPGAPGDQDDQDNQGGNNNNDDDNNNDGGLPDTGAAGIGMAAAAGLLLVGGGTGALLLNRRRRGAHVASDS